MADLSGKHALVTGGGTGIGAAIALALHADGAQVTIAGRRAAPLEETARQGTDIATVTADVTDEAAVNDMLAAARAAHGPVDILIANAGAAESRPVDTTDLALWQRMLAVNLTGVFLTARAALEDMRSTGWGRIVAVASTAGLKGYPYVAAYCAAKHGVVGLTRALALELARTGITVNAVCPGFTETPLLDESLRTITGKTGRSEADAREALAAANPQGRFVTPDEVAGTVLWLAGDAAASVTGQAISVSGGEV